MRSKLFNCVEEESPISICDERGRLEVLFENQDFTLKRSHSHRGVFRGLHIQLPPFAQRKLIRVLSGELIDVIVDCCPTSSTFGCWDRQIMTPVSGCILIPEYFAHGFFCKTDVVFEYLCLGSPYSPEHERCLKVLPEMIPDIKLEELSLSAKDNKGFELKKFLGLFEGVAWADYE